MTTNNDKSVFSSVLHFLKKVTDTFTKRCCWVFYDFLKPCRKPVVSGTVLRSGITFPNEYTKCREWIASDKLLENVYFFSKIYKSIPQRKSMYIYLPKQHILRPLHPLCGTKSLIAESTVAVTWSFNKTSFSNWQMFAENLIWNKKRQSRERGEIIEKVSRLWNGTRWSTITIIRITIWWVFLGWAVKISGGRSTQIFYWSKSINAIM